MMNLIKRMKTITLKMNVKEIIFLINTKNIEKDALELCRMKHTNQGC